MQRQTYAIGTGAVLALVFGLVFGPACAQRAQPTEATTPAARGPLSPDVDPADRPTTGLEGPPNTAAPATGGVEGQARPDITNDEWLAQAVRRELLQARGIPAGEVDVTADLGVVTLQGTVENILAKERAATLAQMVKGVRAVVDLIEVEPPAIANEALRKDVVQAMAWDPAIEPESIDVTVRDGSVTLRGTADSWAEKQLAVAAAKSVRGVAAVNDELALRYGSARSDTEIRDEIESRLQWDARVNAGMIRVSVQGGEVTLSGLTGSAYEKALAMADAWVRGVDDVDAAHLEVDWSRHQELFGEDGKQVLDPPRTDDDVREAVAAALHRDPRVAAFAIDVNARNGLLTLRGKVGNLKAKRAAAQDAANTTGVWRVVNLLEVRTPDVVPAAQLAARVNQALRRDPYVSHYGVGVSARNGTVILRGEVSSLFEKWHADDAAARVVGVREVDNRLQVDYQPLAYEEPFYDWDPLTNEYDPVLPTQVVQTDPELRQSVENEMWWSPYLDVTRIATAAEDGVVTLTGTVPSWEARVAATAEAYEGGARHVVNLLTVD